MALPIRPAIAATALLLLGGCQTVFDAVGVAEPLTAQESRRFNGSYQGRVRQILHTKGCPTEDAERVIMVGDGVLWYAYTPVTFLTTPIHYDGTMDATAGDTHMTGRVTGDHLEATIVSPRCRTELSMDYIENHS